MNTVNDNLFPIETGNGEPEVYRDAQGFARWGDGKAVTLQEIQDDESLVLAAVIGRNGLRVVEEPDMPVAESAHDVLRRMCRRHIEMARLLGLPPYVGLLDDCDERGEAQA